MLTQGLLKAKPVTEVSHCMFEIQTLVTFVGLNKLCLMYFVFYIFLYLEIRRLNKLHKDAYG